MQRDFNKDWALRLVEAGLFVFPCGPDKKPLIRWRTLSSSNAMAVAQMWLQYPGALPGIDLEKCKLVALDGDRHGGPDGVAVLRTLLQQQPDFSGRATPAAYTPGNGIHCYFAANGHDLTNARGDLPDGVDVRAAGGYTICPYAVLPDGRRYHAVPNTPDLISAYKAGTIPHVPQGVVELINARKRKDQTSGEARFQYGTEKCTGTAGIREDSWALAALEGCSAELAAAPPGKRNEMCNAIAYRLGRMIARGWIQRTEVEAVLIEAMTANGYVADKGMHAVEATLKSGLDAGMGHPHEDLRDEEEAPAGQDTDDDQFEDAATAAGLGEWDAGDDAAVPPPRGWLLGNTFCRGFLSSLLAPGGVGKTSVRYAQLMSLATGRALTGEHVFQRARVLIVSLEDDRRELNRRILAARLHHNVALAELKGWLFLCAPGATGGKLMTADRRGRTVRGALADKLEAVIVQRGIDLVFLDPFVKSHSVDENANSAIDDVAQVLTDLCAKHDIAVDAPHHTSKGASDPGNADRGRGASAHRDAGRLVYTLAPMAVAEAQALGVAEEQRRLLVRMDSAKANISPPLAAARWFRLVGVPLGNATETYPNGDSVQTVEPWTPPDTWGDLTVDLLNRILTAIDAGMPDGNRYTDAPNVDTRAAWKVVQEHAPQKTEFQSREVIRTWLKNGVLVRHEYVNPVTRKAARGLRLDPLKRPS